MDQKNEQTHSEYYKNGVDYAQTFYTTSSRLEKSGMLKTFMGLEKIPDKEAMPAFELFLERARINANNLCVRDLIEKNIQKQEDELKAFMNGFEKTLLELLTV